MRQGFARRIATAALLTAVAAGPGLAQDAADSKPRSSMPEAPPATLSITVRVTPANVWKVAGDLGQMMRDGGRSSTPLLNHLLGIISAEMTLDRGAGPAIPSSGIRVSSDPLVQAVRKGGIAAAAKEWPRQKQAVANQTSAAGPSLDEAYAGAIRTAEQHAAIARGGYDAIAGGLSEMKVADLKQRMQQLADSSPALRSTLTQFDGVLADVARAAYDQARKAVAADAKR